MSYPCNFRCESFYVIFLFLKKRFRDKDWHVYVLYTCLFESSVQFMLDVLPDCISCRFDCHAAFNAGISAQFSFLYNVGIPLGEIVFHRCDGFYQFLVVCHDFSPFYVIVLILTVHQDIVAAECGQKKKPSIPHKGPKGFGGTTLISTVPKCLHTARSSSDNAGKNAVLQLHGAPRPVP